jgi:hypothetical protein
VFPADDVGSIGRTISGPAGVLFVNLPPEAVLGS